MSLRFRMVGTIAAVVLVGATVPALAADRPALRVQDETAVLTFRDDRQSTVTLRIPLALYRPANAFRLYGDRPLTLHDAGRRQDLYRDAFLELATRSRLTPATTAWDTVSRQWEALGGSRLKLALPAGTQLPSVPLPQEATDAASEAQRALSEVAKQVAARPEYRHFTALTRALGKEISLPVAEPVAQALQLRALATDVAEQRLLAFGQALGLQGPAATAADPALLAGYRAARLEFEQVRQGVWPAIAASVEKQQGRLLLSAVKPIVFSRIGIWALFGSLGWQTVEGAFNAEYWGQEAICLATLASLLSETAQRDPSLADAALYAEFAMNYQVSEAFKDGQVFGLQAAGGRTGPSWHIQCNARCDELRKALTAP